MTNDERIDERMKRYMQLSNFVHGHYPEASVLMGIYDRYMIGNYPEAILAKIALDAIFNDDMLPSQASAWLGKANGSYHDIVDENHYKGITNSEGDIYVSN